MSYASARRLARTRPVRLFALALLACAARASSLAAQGSASLAATSRGGRPLAIEDYYRVKTIGSVALSPDGRWVAFTVSTRIEDTNGNQSEVWLVPADASAPARRVSAGGANAVGPEWVEGTRLRYAVGNVAITIDPSTPERADTASATEARAGGRGGRGGRGGGGTGRLTSPDGKWVATVRDIAPPKRERTYASDFEKRHEERFKGVEFDWMDFHRDAGPFPVPDRRDPQVSPPQEIFLAQAGAAGGERQLTRLGLRPAGAEWNHDGTALLFTADSAYRNERSYGRSDIWTVGTDGQPRRLTSGTQYDYRGARYSPDGRWILATRAFAEDYVIGKKLGHGGPIDLIVMPASGGAETNLTADWDFLPVNPMWSPDGKYVYFIGGIGGTTHLFRVAPTGGAVEQVTKGERRLGDWAFDAGMHRVAFTVALMESPSELHVAQIDGSGEKQLTHVHDAFTSEVALSRAERLQYKSADGTPIEGWLIFPYGYRAGGGPYPLIVSNHGGPHSAIEYGFNFKNQYFAANGYFVLEVNFRSSTGYGEKFLWGTWGAWGTKDGQDVMSGVDYVIAHYPVDKGEVATIGHSYGGFMTNWLITQYPDRFAAAIPGAGIVDWLSDYGNSDIPITKEKEFYGGPWDPKAREVMLRQSPLIYANRVKAATLFINGEIDQRVPFSEAQQMYVALKKNGVPAKMIRYADQPHSIGGSWNNVHRMLNERRWLDNYLKHKT